MFKEPFNDTPTLLVAARGLRNPMDDPVAWLSSKVKSFFSIYLMAWMVLIRSLMLIMSENPRFLIFEIVDELNSI
jgi:hypothetical protein